MELLLLTLMSTRYEYVTRIFIEIHIISTSIELKQMS